MWRVLLFSSLFVGKLLYALPAAITFPKKPGPYDFIVDEANLISPEGEEKLRRRLKKLLQERAVPILVVTIPSLAHYGAKGIPIEVYAMELYNTWGIGHKKVVIRGPGFGRQEEREWNRGVLLLIALQDRKARIELGAGYGHRMDETCQQIMDNHIIPYFRKGEYEQGIIQGVLALEAMVRGEEIPLPPRPLWHYLLVIGAIALAVFTAVSLYRKGASGWAWAFWTVVFAIIAYILYLLLTLSSDSSFEEGSFGGGFSGGGGATGSW